MSHQRLWRRATAWVVAIYLAAQLIDITTILFWEKGGALPWVDGITTGIYSITPLYVFVIIGFGLTRRKTAFTLASDRSCLFDRPFFRSSSTSRLQGIRFTHWTLLARLSSLGFHLGSYFFNMEFILSTLLIPGFDFHHRARAISGARAPGPDRA